MAVKCKLRKVSGVLKDTDKFFPEAINFSRIDADRFLDSIANNSQVGRPQVQSTMAAVAENMLYFLQNGHSVEVPYLGTISLAIKGSVEKDEKGKFVLKDAQFRRLELQPSVSLLRQLKQTKFELATSSVKKMPISSREDVLGVVQKLCERDGYVTIQTYCHTTGSSPYMTKKALKSLLNEGLIIETHSGRIAIYRLAE